MTRFAQRLLRRHAAQRLRPRGRSRGGKQGAATQTLLATHPGVLPYSGQYFSDCQPASTLPVGQSDAAADELWAWTEALLARLG